MRTPAFAAHVAMSRVRMHVEEPRPDPELDDATDDEAPEPPVDGPDE